MAVLINGTEYTLANTLRVAYEIQGQNNHKPYTQIFSEIGDMPIEKQISLLYSAFKVANPTTVLKPQEFLDYYLDNYTAKYVLEQLKELISGIMGIDPDEETNASATATASEESSGN